MNSKQYLLQSVIKCAAFCIFLFAVPISVLVYTTPLVTAWIGQLGEQSSAVALGVRTLLFGIVLSLSLLGFHVMLPLLPKAYRGNIHGR